MICEPRNQEPHAKLIDFGIAKVINGEVTPAGLTSTGDVLGSPAYMSPEQANGSKVDSRTDIYSLGCVMFEALTGTQPFRGATALEVISHQINTKAPTLEERSMSEFPRKLQRIIAKTLEKDPNNRFQTMQQLRTELVDVLAAASDTTGNATHEDEVASLESKTTRISVVMIACIVLTILTATNIGLLLFKNAEMEKQHQIKRAQGAQEANDAAHYDPDLVSRQMMMEAIEKWKRGERTRLGVQCSDAQLNEFGKVKPDLTYIDLDNSFVKGPGLAYLIRYPLDFLSLNDASISDRAFLEIEHMSKLKTLQIDNVEITAAGLKHLEHLPLDRLSIRNDKLGDSALKTVAKIDSLVHLQCGRNGDLTGTGYLLLKALPHLEKLDVMENHIDANAAKAISQLNIRELNFEKSDVNDDDLKLISSMPSLNQIGLCECQHVTGAGLKYLTKLPRLIIINLDGANPISDKDLEFISNCKNLLSLDIRNTNVTDKTLELVANSNIRLLFLQNDKITERGVMSLLKDKSLKEVQISGDVISKEALNQFNKLRPGVLTVTRGKSNGGF